MNEKTAVFTAEEMAEKLKVPTATVCRMARLGQLQGRKVGNKWRFYADAVEKFFDGAPSCA